MKIIHCSDLHLDSAIVGIPTEKSKIMRDEIVRTFERLCDFALQNKVQVVLICGDMFDSQKITAKTYGRVFSAIEKCKDTKFIYVLGNHDNNAKQSLLSMPKNFIMIENDWQYFNFDKVTIACANLENGNFKYLTQSLQLNKNSFNIVALHGEVVGYNTVDTAEEISIPQLKNKNINYLALGHYHSYAQGQIDLNGIYAYSGCLSGRGFDETGEKGFILLDVQDDLKYTAEFIPFSARQLHQIEFLVTGYANYFQAEDALFSLLKNKISQDDLVKIVLKGEREEDFEIDINGTASRLNQYYFFAKVKDKTKFKTDINDYVNDKSVRGEFVREVFNSKLSEQDKEKVLAIGLKALKGEEF